MHGGTIKKKLKIKFLHISIRTFCGVITSIYLLAMNSIFPTINRFLENIIVYAKNVFISG